MIEVCEYQESWPERFEARRLYVKAMGDGSVDVLAIEHVGSTSVPGLAAKPTIDCDIVVEADRVDAATEVLKSLGFRPLGELGIPLRWAFKEPPDFPSTNTYVIVDGSCPCATTSPYGTPFATTRASASGMPLSRRWSPKAPPT